MPPDPKTYEDWLSLLPKERDEIHFKHWNVYERDGIAIALMAAVRLALQSSVPILDIKTGIYHGGEFVLQLTVSQNDYRNCPPMLEQSFEGFRVIWLPHQYIETDPTTGASLDGKWLAESGDYEFELRRTESGVNIVGFSRATGERLVVSNTAVDRAFVHLTSFHPTLAKTINHVFRLCGADRCEDYVMTCEYYARIASTKDD